jgi:hypothetical protein
MVWLGIEAAFDLHGETLGAKLTLASASPGILLALAGVVLIAISLYKPLHYSEESPANAGRPEPLPQNTEPSPADPPRESNQEEIGQEVAVYLNCYVVVC